MQSLKVILIGLLIFSASYFVQAAPNDTYSFDDPVTEQRYRELVKELRCPKCQNQNLADSNSQIAIDLRDQVYAMLHQNKSDQEIVMYMVDRYGEFVLYRPKVNKLTYALWFGPAIFLLVGFIIIISIARKKSASKKELELDSVQQDKLNQILKDKE